MALFQDGAFDGSLAELIDRCLRFVPTPASLAAADQWLAGLERDGRLLPLRKFAGHANRGEVFSIGRRRFVPVDNETLAHLYRELLNGSVPNGDFEDLYSRGALTLSWRLDTDASALGPSVRKGQVAAPFRDEGLKLAHLIDAARGCVGSTEDDFVQRFRLSLNPLNCFPFPSPRRFRFEKVRGRSDPGEAPHIQTLLADALAEHSGEAFAAYRARVRGDRAQPTRWRDVAADIHIRFELRTSGRRPVFSGASAPSVARERDSTKVIASDVDAVTPRESPLRLESLAALVDVLRDWRRACGSAERLNGHRTFLKTNRKTGKQSISRSDPKPYVYFRLTRECAHEVPEDAIRTWHLNGDTKVAAIDELLALYESQESFDDIFRQESVETQEKLVLQGRDESEGLYCYG